MGQQSTKQVHTPPRSTPSKSTTITTRHTHYILPDSVQAVLSLPAANSASSLEHSIGDFASLPNEILVEICGLLQPTDILKLSTASRGMFTLCSDDYVWRALYRYEYANELDNKGEGLLGFDDPCCEKGRFLARYTSAPYKAVRIHRKLRILTTQRDAETKVEEERYNALVTPIRARLASTRVALSVIGCILLLLLIPMLWPVYSAIIMLPYMLVELLLAWLSGCFGSLSVLYPNYETIHCLEHFVTNALDNGTEVQIAEVVCLHGNQMVGCLVPTVLLWILWLINCFLRIAVVLLASIGAVWWLHSSKKVAAYLVKQYPGLFDTSVYDTEHERRLLELTIKFAEISKLTDKLRSLESQIGKPFSGDSSGGPPNHQCVVS